MLSSAQALVEGREFDSAIQLYGQLLERDLAAPQLGEVQSNFGAALCITARGKEAAVALAQLDQARALLTSALEHRTRRHTPVAWATSRANLALVYLARHEVTASSDDLMSAHLALDGIEPVLRSAGEAELLGWALAIRDHLVELNERRSKRR